MINRLGVVFKNIVGCILVLTLSGGCVEHEYYDYAPVQTNLLNGILVISVQSTASNMEKEGKKVKRGAPYYLGFTFRRDVSNKFVKMEVLDLVIVGEKTNKQAELGDLEATRIVDLSKVDANERRLETNIATEIPANAGVVYEAIRVRARIRVYDEENQYTEKEIDVLLDTKYRKEKRSGFFDKWLSI